MGNPRLGSERFDRQAYDFDIGILYGRVYAASHVFTAVANNGKVYIHLTTTTKPVLVTVAVAAAGKARLKSYAGSTFSDPGTAVTPYNRRTDKPAGTALVYHTPVGLVLGSQRLNQLIAGGETGGTRAGSSSNDSLGTYIHAGVDVMLEVENQSGVEGDIGVIATFQEIDL